MCGEYCHCENNTSLKTWSNRVGWWSRNNNRWLSVRKFGACLAVLTTYSMTGARSRW